MAYANKLKKQLKLNLTPQVKKHNFVRDNTIDHKAFKKITNTMTPSTLSN